MCVVQLSLRLRLPGMCCGSTGFINNRQKEADTKGTAVLSRTTLAELPLHPPDYYQRLTGAVSAGPTQPACLPASIPAAPVSTAMLGQNTLTVV